MERVMLCAICLIILVSGCGEQLGLTESPWWKEQWNKLRAQATAATPWDKLPYPWLIESRGKYYCRAQGISMDERIRRQAEVKQFLGIVNARRREWYVAINPELPAQTKEYILAGAVVIGMTDEQVIAAKGHHGSNVNRSVGSWGIHEQWVYGDFPYCSYLYFENGILTSWQD